MEYENLTTSPGHQLHLPRRRGIRVPDFHWPIHAVFLLDPSGPVLICVVPVGFPQVLQPCGIVTSTEDWDPIALMSLPWEVMRNLARSLSGTSRQPLPEVPVFFISLASTLPPGEPVNCACRLSTHNTILWALLGLRIHILLLDKRTDTDSVSQCENTIH